MPPDARIEAGVFNAFTLGGAPLSAQALQNLYLIYKEALHNVVKHARATHVTVHFSYAPTGLRLAVTDNGQGADAAGRPAGHGLRNMQVRAQAVGGTVRYEAQAPGFGVVVQLPWVVLKPATACSRCGGSKGVHRGRAPAVLRRRRRQLSRAGAVQHGHRFAVALLGQVLAA